jgi:hypothetical protein
MSTAGSEDDKRAYLASLQELRSNDLITADDENRLIRHYDDQKASIEAAFAKFLPEYQRRVREDGEAAANEWMATAAREMGQREGEAARTLSESLDASRNASN